MTVYPQSASEALDTLLGLARANALETDYAICAIGVPFQVWIDGWALYGARVEAHGTTGTPRLMVHCYGEELQAELPVAAHDWFWGQIYSREES